MNISIESNNETMRLTGALDIYAAEKVHQTLREQLETRLHLTLDLAGVTSCDLTGVQLLCSLKKTGAQSGRVIRIEPVSSAVSECCVQLGFAPEFAHQPSC